jgi:hypothetical protein
MVDNYTILVALGFCLLHALKKSCQVSIFLRLSVIMMVLMRKRDEEKKGRDLLFCIILFLFYIKPFYLFLK